MSEIERKNTGLEREERRTKREGGEEEERMRESSETKVGCCG